MARRKRKEQWTTKRVLGVSVVIMFVAFFIFMGPAQMLWTQYAPEAWREKPEGVTEDSMQVDLSIKTMHSLDRGDPAATPIRVYDANKHFIESASTSSGIATFAAPYWEGETIYLQARAAAPSSTGYVIYTTTMLEYTVPEGDVNGDAELPLLELHETSVNVATFIATDQSGNKIGTSATVDNVNTTDTSVIVTVTIDGDTCYGTPADFIDYDTGKNYLAGVWLVLATDTDQPISNYQHMFSTPTLFYYVWSIPMIVHDDDLGYAGAYAFTMKASSDFVADTTFDMDIFDTCWAASLATITSNSFLDGDSDLNPTQLLGIVA